MTSPSRPTINVCVFGFVLLYFCAMLTRQQIEIAIGFTEAEITSIKLKLKKNTIENIVKYTKKYDRSQEINCVAVFTHMEIVILY